MSILDERLEQIARDFPFATGAALDELTLEAAEIMAALDPDAVDIETPMVSEWQDERNSRPIV